MKVDWQTLLRRPSLLCALVTLASAVSYSCGGAGGSGQSAVSPASSAANPAAAGQGAACVDQLPMTDCFAYTIERESVVELLEDLERAQDQRSVPAAAEALDSADPVVTAAGLRLLGPFAGSAPDAVARAAPLINSPFLSTAALAAEVLARSPTHGMLAAQYQMGHRESYVDQHPWARLPPVDVTQLGFPAPTAGAVPFTPGDSPFSVGFARPEAAEALTQSLASALGKPTQPFAQFEAAIQQSDSKRAEQLMEKIRVLQEEFQRTQDPKVAERIDQVAGDGSAAQPALSVVPLPLGPGRDSAQVIVAEEDAGQPARFVVVYREALLNTSVVIYVWLAPKYPARPREVQPLPERRLPF